MTTKQTHLTPSVAPRKRSRFQAIDHALDAVRSLYDAVVKLKKRDAHLADQVRRALSNVCLNLGEGAYRAGGNQQLSFRRAAGEAHEAIIALEVAVAWRVLDADEVAVGLDRLDHVLAILAKLR